MTTPRLPSSLLANAIVLCFAVGAAASQPRTVLASAQDLWRGEASGVSVGEDGVLSRGIAFREAAPLRGTPLCAAAAGDAVYVGTGPSGDLLKVTGGRAEVLHHFAEPLVTALAVLPSGALLVGTSAPARLYRVETAKGGATLLGEVPAQYLWAVAVRGEAVLAAAGVPGGLWRLSQGRDPERLCDPGARHVRCLLGTDGGLWFGTSGPAALYRMDGGGKILRRTSFSQEEVAALSASGNDLLLALNEKADASDDPPPKEAPAAPPAGPEPGKGSALVRLREGGAPETLRLLRPSLLSLASRGGRVYAGCRDGALLEVRPEGVFLAARWEEAPVSALCDRPAGLLAATGGTLWEETPAVAVRRYTAPVVDAGSPARAGRLEGFGEGAYSLALRAGDGPRPDAFWSDFVPASSAASLPPARYFQWRASMETPGATVRGVGFTYRTVNRPPVFEEARVAPPGEIQVKTPSELGDLLVREVHEKDRPFPPLAESRPSEGGATQTYYLYGFRMITFKVSDADGDAVRVDLQLRPEGSDAWFPLGENVEDPFYVFDARGLPDGRYQVLLVARDDASNPDEEAGRARRLLPVFEVDNTPPALEERGRDRTLLRLQASDASGVRAARYSVDGGRWRPLEGEPEAEGKTVRLAVPLPAAGRHWLAVEAVDPYGNRTAKGFFVP